jgi:hypothetical protein
MIAILLSSLLRYRIGAASVFLAMPAGLLAQAASPSCGRVRHQGGRADRPGYAVVYSARFDSSGTWLQGLIVVRASDAFRSISSSQPQPSQWRVNGVTRMLGGASVGPLLIAHEQSTNTVWLDSLSIPLDTNNVLLVQVDTTGVAHVAGQARIEPRLSMPTGPCDEAAVPGGEQFLDRMIARLQESPQVRGFLAR